MPYLFMVGVPKKISDEDRKKVLDLVLSTLRGLNVALYENGVPSKKGAFIYESLGILRDVIENRIELTQSVPIAAVGFNSQYKPTLYINPVNILEDPVMMENLDFVLLHELGHLEANDLMYTLKSGLDNAILNCIEDAYINEGLSAILGRRLEGIIYYDVLANMIRQGIDALRQYDERLANTIASTVGDVSTLFTRFTPMNVYDLLKGLRDNLMKYDQSAAKQIMGPCVSFEGGKLGGEPCGEQNGETVICEPRNNGGGGGGNKGNQKGGGNKSERERAVENTNQQVNQSSEYWHGWGLENGFATDLTIDNLENAEQLSHVDWRNILIKVMSSAKYNVISTWTKPNRYSDELPGHRTFGYPSLVALVDTSGSIPNDMYKFFLDELSNAARQVQIDTIHLLLFTVDVDKVITLRGGQVRDVFSAVSSQLSNQRFSGGTDINKPLTKSLEFANKNSVITILSDGDFSFGSQEIALAQRVANQYGGAIFITTFLAQPFPRPWQVFSINQTVPT